MKSSWCLLDYCLETNQIFRDSTETAYQHWPRRNHSQHNWMWKWLRRKWGKKTLNFTCYCIRPKKILWKTNGNFQLQLPTGHYHGKATLKNSHLLLSDEKQKKVVVFGFSRKQTPWEYQLWSHGIFRCGQTLK